MKEKTILVLNNTVQGSFAGTASAFIGQTLSHMIPWLMVTAAVILCDLAFGVRKSLIMGEEVRFSRAVRNTMGKMVTYFAFVCMGCMICVASGEQYGIDQWSCLLVCFIEGCSIIGNILKPKGIDFNLLGAFREIGKATFRKVNMEVDTEKVFVEEKSPWRRTARKPKPDGDK